jgi:hypothetical protein
LHQAQVAVHQKCPVVGRVPDSELGRAALLHLGDRAPNKSRLAAWELEHAALLTHIQNQLTILGTAFSAISEQAEGERSGSGLRRWAPED